MPLDDVNIKKVSVVMAQRRDTSENWESDNPILNDGELGYDKTNKRLKIGDGETAWNDLTSITSVVQDSNGNSTSDAENNEIISSGTMNNAEGINAYIGISRIPAVKMTQSDIDSNIISLINYPNCFDRSSVQFGHKLYASKITVNEDSTITYSVTQNTISTMYDTAGVAYTEYAGSFSKNTDAYIKIENAVEIYSVDYLSMDSAPSYVIESDNCFAIGNGVAVSADSFSFTGELDTNFSHVEGVANTAISDATHAEGSYNIVGCKAYRILESNIEESSYTLDSVKGLVAGDVYSLKINNNYNDNGEIVSVDASSNKVIVTNFVSDTLMEITDNASIANTFKINEKPFLGTIDFAYNSHVEGAMNRVLADEGHAEGRKNTTIGRYGHTEGRRNIAGYAAHAQNTGNIALGINSTAMGKYTQASGESSVSMGNNTIAYGDNQLVIGKYNTIDNTGKYAYIVGNGTSPTVRSNAHTLDWNGDAEYARNLTVGREIMAEDAKLNRLATALEVYGNTVLDFEGITYPQSIENITVDNTKIFSGPETIDPLYGLTTYKDILSIGSKIVHKHNIEKIHLDPSDSISWSYSTNYSSDEYSVFFASLEKSKYSDGSAIIPIIPYVYTDDAKCFLTMEDGTITELPLSLSKAKDIDGAFWIEQGESVSSVFRLWIVTKQDIMSTISQIKNCSFDLYVAVREPSETILTDKFANVWSDIKKIYTRTSTIKADITMSNGTSRTDVCGINHSIIDALESIDIKNFEIPDTGGFDDIIDLSGNFAKLDEITEPGTYKLTGYDDWDNWDGILIVNHELADTNDTLNNNHYICQTRILSGTMKTRYSTSLDPITWGGWRSGTESNVQSIVTVGNVTNLSTSAQAGDTRVVTNDTVENNGMYLYINGTWNKIAMESTTIATGDTLSGGNA